MTCCWAAKDLVRNYLFELSCISVLLEGDNLAIAKRKEVSKLCPRLLLVFSIRSTVVTMANYHTAGVKQLFWGNCEPFPLRTYPHKYTFEYRIRTNVRVLIGVDKVFRLPPFNFL